MKVTPGLILRHDLASFGSAVLALAGAFIIWLLQSLFLWALCSLILQWNELSAKVWLICGGLPLLVMLIKLRSIKLTERSWKDSLPEYETDPSLLGAKLLARGLNVSPTEGVAIMELITEAGPKMIKRAFEYIRGMLSPSQKESQQLEKVRHNLAARDSWELFQDFESREHEIRKLVSLGLVTVRELSGIWSLRTSLKGQR